MDTRVWLLLGVALLLLSVSFFARHQTIQEDLSAYPYRRVVNMVFDLNNYTGVPLMFFSLDSYDVRFTPAPYLRFTVEYNQPALVFSGGYMYIGSYAPDYFMKYPGGIVAYANGYICRPVNRHQSPECSATQATYVGPPYTYVYNPHDGYLYLFANNGGFLYVEVFDPVDLNVVREVNLQVPVEVFSTHARVMPDGTIHILDFYYLETSPYLYLIKYDPSTDSVYSVLLEAAVDGVYSMDFYETDDMINVMLVGSAGAVGEGVHLLWFSTTGALRYSQAVAFESSRSAGAVCLPDYNMCFAFELDTVAPYDPLFFLWSDMNYQKEPAYEYTGSPSGAATVDYVWSDVLPDGNLLLTYVAGFVDVPAILNPRSLEFYPQLEPFFSAVPAAGQYVSYDDLNLSFGLHYVLGPQASLVFFYPAGEEYIVPALTVNSFNYVDVLMLSQLPGATVRVYYGADTVDRFYDYYNALDELAQASVANGPAAFLPTLLYVDFGDANCDGTRCYVQAVDSASRLRVSATDLLPFMPTVAVIARDYALSAYVSECNGDCGSGFGIYFNGRSGLTPGVAQQGTVFDGVVGGYTFDGAVFGHEGDYVFPPLPTDTQLTGEYPGVGADFLALIKPADLSEWWFNFTRMFVHVGTSADYFYSFPTTLYFFAEVNVAAGGHGNILFDYPVFAFSNPPEYISELFVGEEEELAPSAPPAPSGGGGGGAPLPSGGLTAGVSQPAPTEERPFPWWLLILVVLALYIGWRWYSARRR